METRRLKTDHQIGMPAGSRTVGGRCKKHPKHQQSPGVCSVCLRERLSRISTSSRSSVAAAATSCSSSSSSSSLSSLSSHYSSSESSPVHDHDIHRFSAKESVLIMTKSRSMAFVGRMRSGGEGKKKGGFWSKLLRPRSKNNIDGSLMHSKTMRERFTFTARVR